MTWMNYSLLCTVFSGSLSSRQLQILGRYIHSSKYSGLNFRKFSGANGTKFPVDCIRVESENSHFCSLGIFQ